MLLFVLALGCQNGGSTAVACESSDCRVQRVLDLWESNPKAAETALGELSQVERIAATSKLVVSHPEAATTLCEHFEDDKTAHWCEGVERRPHLWVELPPQAGASAGRTAPGPAATSALPLRPLPSSLGDTTPRPGPCKQEQGRQDCQTRRASRGAAKGRGQVAAAACLALPNPTWQQECFFRAAESSVRATQVEGYPLAAQLCAFAGEFAANCYWHTSMALAQAAPAADNADPAAWSGVLDGHRVLEETWAEVDPAFGAHLQGFLWSRATSEAMATANNLDGTATVALPLVAMPHLRAALAIELMRRKGPGSQDLEAWVEELWLRLGGEGSHLPTPEPTGSYGLAAKVDLWPIDVGQDGEIPAVLYLGGSRRAVARDRKRDLAICVLEGASRLSPPAPELIAQAREHEDPILAWTANRLLAALSEGG